MPSIRWYLITLLSFTVYPLIQPIYRLYSPIQDFRGNTLFSIYRDNKAFWVISTDHIILLSNPPLFLFSPHSSPYKAELPHPSFKTGKIKKKDRKGEDTYAENPLISLHQSHIHPLLSFLFPTALSEEKRGNTGFLGDGLLWEFPWMRLPLED